MVDATIFYHQIKPGIDCADGSAASWVCHRYLQQQAPPPAIEIVGCAYNEPIPLVDPDWPRAIYIVDFSFPAEVLQAWLATGHQVTLLDHHKTAQQMLGGLLQPRSLEQIVFQRQGNLTLGFDMLECGATITWKYFFPEHPVPLFLQYVRDRDLWLHQLPDTELVHLAYTATGRSFEIYDRYYALGADFVAVAVEYGQSVKQEKDRTIQQVIQRHQVGVIAGYPHIPYVYLQTDEESRYTSDICAELLRLYPQAFFTAACGTNHAWSLRSLPTGADVSRIAQAWGGGGHQTAAGLQTTDSHFFKLNGQPT